jgi:hypothetical protein
MQALLNTAQIGLSAARHLAWYVSHQVGGPTPR